MIAAYIAALVAGVLLALVLYYPLAAIAKLVGLVDHPDRKRKLHTQVVPLVGGILICLVTAIVVPAVLIAFNDGVAGIRRWELLGLLLAGLVILGVGVLDDRFNIRGRQKLCGQVIAATVLIAFGFQFNRIAFAGITIDFGIFSIVVAYIWILVAINSVNLLDGADGFATTIGIVVFGALSVMAVFSRDATYSVVCLAMTGSLIGFLRFNFPPARAFLGDAGSMLIGLVLAGVTIQCSFKQHTAYAFFAPVALLAIPIIDTFAAILRRRLTGRSIYATDRGHLHHTMAKKGLGPKSSLLWVGILTATTATGAIFSYFTQQSEFALLSIVIVVFVLIAGRIFGDAEFNLVSRRAISMVKSLAGVSREKIHHSSVQLQGSRDWNHIWQQLLQFGEEVSLNEITLDVNAPWIHESFHATRRLSGKERSESDEWNCEVPLICDGRIFGRIIVWDSVDGTLGHHETISNLLKITFDLEDSAKNLLAPDHRAMEETTVEKIDEVASGHGDPHDPVEVRPSSL